MNMYDETMFNLALRYINEARDTNLLKSDTILLNQVLNDLKSTGQLHEKYLELHEICKSQSLKYDLECFKKCDAEIRLHKGRDLKETIEMAHFKLGKSDIKFNVPLNEIGYTCLLEYEDKRLFLVDPLIKNNDNQLNGYNRIKLRQIAEQCQKDGKQLIIKDMHQVILALQYKSYEDQLNQLYSE